MKGERSVQQQTSKGEEQTKVGEKNFMNANIICLKQMMFSRDFGIFSGRNVEC